MVVNIKIGRRVPRNFFKNAAYKTAGLFTFQENMWLIISRALQMAKNECDTRPEEYVNIELPNIDRGALDLLQSISRGFTGQTFWCTNDNLKLLCDSISNEMTSIVKASKII